MTRFQSYASPFKPGPLPGLDTASCLSVFMYLNAVDLAILSMVSRKCCKLVREAVQLSCISVYNRKMPVSRPGEPATRLLQFIERLNLAQQLQGLQRDSPFITAGAFHTLVQTVRGRVYGFGDSAAGQVGQ